MKMDTFLVGFVMRNGCVDVISSMAMERIFCFHLEEAIKFNAIDIVGMGINSCFQMTKLLVLGGPDKKAGSAYA
jgi:hypothetical protein